MKPNFVVVDNVLLPIASHIGTGMPYLHIFVEDIVMFVGLINGCENMSVVGIRNRI